MAGGVDGFGRQYVGDGFLEAGAHVGDGDLTAFDASLFYPSSDGGLEAGEGEVEAVLLEVVSGCEAAGETNSRRVPLLREFVDHRPARVGEPQQAGDLVVGLAGGVVDGGPEFGDVRRDVTHVEQRRVAARDEQRQRRRRQRPMVEQVDGDVADEVVHAVERFAEIGGEGLGRREPHHERPHEPGTRGDGDGVDVGEINVCGARGAFKRGHDGGQMRAARHLRHHPTEANVEVHRARHLVGEQRRSAHDTDAGLVAGGFDTQDQRLAHGWQFLSITSASAPAP